MQRLSLLEDGSRVGSPEPAVEDAAPGLSDLRRRALESLDFEVVRHQVAGHITFAPARPLALGMTPSYRFQEVADLQRETADARQLLDQLGEVNLHAEIDASTFVARAALDGVLTGLELLAVAESLDMQRRARAAVARAGDRAPILAAMVDQISDLRELERQIRVRIGRTGEVLDDATPTLRAVRIQVRQAYERVTDALTRIIQSPLGQESLQDRVISVRGERLVVQVKAEMRHRVLGIVHDASNTGATLFIEPFATVDLCNAWRELALEEEREVGRVLRDLSTLVGALADDITRGAQQVARLDFIMARARYSAALRGVSALPGRTAHGPAPSGESPGTVLRLLNARHPLLGDEAVPISANIGPGWSVLVVTGPNTGGKTVAMKTVGLLALMHQSGLLIPADEGSTLPVFDGVYSDVGDQQSIERSVSTFSSHMRNVIDILSEASPASLVLLDELGTSTDPEEGSALAKAILDYLASLGVPTIATTHHRTVATYAEANPGMANASVQLDPDTLRPTYHLTVGIPGRSYAMSVASRMGLSSEIMEKARSLLEPQHLRFEDWLNELQNERHQLQTRLAEAEQTQAEVELSRQELQSQLDDLATHRRDLFDGMRRELLAQWEDLQRKLRRAEAALSWRVPARDIQDVKAELSQIGQELEARRSQAPAPPQRAGQRPLAVGDLVQVRGLNLQGTVTALSEEGLEAEVNVGKVRLRIDLGRLSRVEGEPGTETAEVHLELGPALADMDLHLRGLRAEEALVRLEDFLDKATRDGLSTVRIIHGRGTGVLRQVVREHLARHPLAISFAPEERERGGDGVTVVELA